MDNIVFYVAGGVGVLLLLTGFFLSARRGKRQSRIASLYDSWAEKMGAPKLTDNPKYNDTALKKYFSVKWSGGEPVEIVLHGSPQIIKLTDVVRMATQANSFLKKKTKLFFIFDSEDVQEGDVKLTAVVKGSQEALRFKVEQRLRLLIKTTAPTSQDFLGVDFPRGVTEAGFTHVIISKWSLAEDPQVLSQVEEALEKFSGTPWRGKTMSSSVATFQVDSGEEREVTASEVLSDEDSGNGDMGDMNGLLVDAEEGVMENLDDEIDDLLTYDDEELEEKNEPLAPLSAEELSYSSQHPTSRRRGRRAAPVEQETPQEQAPSRKLPRLFKPLLSWSEEEPEGKRAAIPKVERATVVGYDSENDEPIVASVPSPPEAPRREIPGEELQILSQAIELAGKRSGLEDVDDEPEVISTRGGLPEEFIVYLTSSTSTDDEALRGFMEDMLVILQANFKQEWECGPTEEPATASIYFRRPEMPLPLAS